MNEFDSLIEVKRNELKVNNESYSKKLNEIKTKFGLDSKYNFILKSETSLMIEFETGDFYKDGTPRHTHLDIRYEKSWGANDDYSLSINPYTAGSFDPTGSSYLIDYYKLVGLICSNKEFTNAIKNLMHEYTKKNEPIRNEIYSIENKIREAKRKEELRIAEEKETKKINEIKENLPNSEYALINKKESNSKNFIYRNAYVQIVKCGTFEECENELQALNKKNNKYSIVSASKIKY